MNTDDFSIPTGRTRTKVPGPKVSMTELPPHPDMAPDEDEDTQIGGSDKGDEDKEDSKKDPKKELPKFDKEELLAIFDEILFSGEYVEEFKIRNRLSVKFRTRTAEQIYAVQKHIDSLDVKLISTVEHVRAMMNLREAMVEYNGTDFVAMKPEDKMRFLQALPGPVIAALLTLLNKFDYKVGEACKEGEENF